MYLLYNLLLALVLIILSPLWLLLLISARKFRAGFFQKAGFFPQKIKKELQGFEKKPVWFHAVSVGETIAVTDLVKHFSQQNPDIPVVFSTVTLTGQQIANKNLGDIATIIYFPYDLGLITGKVLQQVSPQLIVIVETEIWPNFAYNAYKKSIPLLLINGRISPKSFRNYLWFKNWLQPVLGYFSRFLMQAGVDADRIRQMGADPAKVEVTGNLKYDITPKLSQEEVENLKKELCLNESDRVIIAGSTHSGEEGLLLDVFLSLRERIHNLKLIMVPRHPERYDEVINLLKTGNHDFCRRSSKENFQQASIMLLDTMGELSNFYAVADVAFVGGSFVEKGGHNPLEPAVYGVPVLLGPHTFNFVDITTYMVRGGAAIQVDSKDKLQSVMFDLLIDRETHERARKATIRVFEDNRGATNRTLSIISGYIER